MLYLAVALGGAVGACARFALGTWLAVGPGRFPLATFCANALGCLLMGALYVALVEKSLLSASLRPLLLVGILGAFTTFSTFALEALVLWQQHHQALASLYVISSVAGSLFSVWAGYTIATLIL